MVMTYLVDGLSLLDLHLKQFLDTALYNLSSLFHRSCKGRQRLVEFCFHLRCNRLMCLAHAVDLAA